MRDGCPQCGSAALPNARIYTCGRVGTDLDQFLQSCHMIAQLRAQNRHLASRVGETEEQLRRAIDEKRRMQLLVEELS